MDGMIWPSAPRGANDIHEARNSLHHRSSQSIIVKRALHCIMHMQFENDADDTDERACNNHEGGAKLLCLETSFPLAAGSAMLHCNLMDDATR